MIIGIFLEYEVLRSGQSGLGREDRRKRKTKEDTETRGGQVLELSMYLLSFCEEREMCGFLEIKAFNSKHINTVSMCY